LMTQTVSRCPGGAFGLACTYTRRQPHGVGF
jgi:hypothetical protein